MLYFLEFYEMNCLIEPTLSMFLRIKYPNACIEIPMTEISEINIRKYSMFYSMTANRIRFTSRLMGNFNMFFKTISLNWKKNIN